MNVPNIQQSGIQHLGLSYALVITSCEHADTFQNSSDRRTLDSPAVRGKSGLQIQAGLAKHAISGLLAGLLHVTQTLLLVFSLSIQSCCHPIISTCFLTLSTLPSGMIPRDRVTEFILNLAICQI